MEISQVVPPEILASIAQVRAAAEALSPAAHGALAYSVEAAEVIGTLTENAELANALVLRPLIGLNGFTPEKLSTTAALTLEQVSGNWTITTVDLQMTAKVPGIDAKKFQEIAADAKANCPVSRVLNAKISLDAKLES